MRKSVFALFFLYLLIAVLTHIFSFNHNVYKNLLRNYGYFGNGYDIFCILVTIVIIGVGTSIPKKIKIIGLPLYLVLLCTIGFLVLFSLNFGTKTYIMLFSRYISVYNMLFASICGVLIGIFMNSNEIVFGIPICISLGVYIL